jgi:DUF1680 family protein
MLNETGSVDHSQLVVRHPEPGRVVLAGRLSSRYAGNQRYLLDLYERRKDWMLEPFRRRGRPWVLEPLRNKKQELSWAGEYAGKWLDAASLVAAGPGEVLLRQQAADFAADLESTQEADGYLGIEPADQRGSSHWDVWNIKYALTGLLTHHEVFQSEHSLRAAIRGGDWLLNRFGTVSAASDPFFSGPYEGAVSVDILDQLVRLYNVTGERKYLEFVNSVAAHFPPVTWMRSTGQAPLIHAYTLAAYLGGLGDWAIADNRPAELQWLEQVWADLAERHAYPTGSLGFSEELKVSAPNDVPVFGGQPERHHQETCATVEWLLFTAQLYRITGLARYVDALEQTVYNALLAAQSDDGMQWMYFTPLRYEKRWFTGPTSCCYWSGPRGIARLPLWIYALDRDGIRVDLYEASDATLQLNGHSVELQQRSHYPDRGQVSLEVRPEQPVNFSMRLRIPPHAGALQVTLNGQPMPAALANDGYYVIHRTWSKGDQVGLTFDIPVSVRPFLDAHYGTLGRGPEILAADQRDNPALDLDQIALPAGPVLSPITPIDGRRRYQGEMTALGRPAQVVFTPYADCGGDDARFRTAFPIV